MALDIINWHGLNGSWSDPGAALHTITSWFANAAHATTIEVDLSEAPKRNDFPGWDHVGNHEYMGKLYWNWFHHNHNGDLIFSDSPDFRGAFWDDGSQSRFYGDIEFVSAQAMAITQKQMRFGEVWISIFAHKQVIIEPMVDIHNIFHHNHHNKRAVEKEESAQIAKPIQLRLL